MCRFLGWRTRYRKLAQRQLQPSAKSSLKREPERLEVGI